MFINKLKTKLSSFFFLQNGFKDTKNLPLLFEEISRQELNKCLRKFYLSSRKRCSPFGHCALKLQSSATVNSVRVKGGMSLWNGTWHGLRNDIIMWKVIYAE